MPRDSIPPASSFWFGATERPLFGWYHAPAGQTARATVVICNPFGHEALVAHRGNRRLAQRLAAEGFAALRFDYDGTGDSAGSDDDPGRLEAWLDSVRRAIVEATTLSRSNRVILIGLRLGALLAALQADRSVVAALVLIAPPRSGKAWLREMRALQSLKDAGRRPEDIQPDDLGIAGFMVGEATRHDLSNLFFSKLKHQPAKHALVVARDDLPSGEPELVACLRGLHVDAELCKAPGYADHMTEDPFKSQVPTQMFDAIIAWLDPLFPTDSYRDEPSRSNTVAPVSVRPSVTNMMTPTPATRERVVDIGGLFGIVTEPAVPSAQVRTAVLMLNIGANNHLGSNRMYVRMARAWAEQGFQVLRMDFSGMGDSPVASHGKENDVYATRFLAEARAGLDFAQTQGATRFVLVGLCSGAYVAYHTAIADPRVSGVVMINPLTFHWQEGDSLEIRMRKSFKSTTQYRRALFRVDTWRRIAGGNVGVAAIGAELARRAERRSLRELKSLLAKVTGGIAEATDVERGFRQLCARGAQCLLVYSAEDGGIDVIEEHLGRDAGDMRRVSGFHMEIKHGPDHTFTPLWTQDWLVSLITSHLLERHGSGSP
ncbi:MAG: alpha/beta fold hydrolase [Polyangiaceae bacterium]